MRQVASVAHLNGWLTYHTHDSRHSAAGFPDLVCAKPKAPVLFLELKALGGTLGPDQQVWRDVLRRSKGAVYLTVYPDDWQTVVDVLEMAW